ncbi:putative universal stress protein A [Candidatus Nitrososphaera gargensis Ga9.2]|uniref:Putative universal stress protein A n=1 Tax=Nitrososphaera gargensis (strain Ga9.2) TaxID=1237085 RepID=K0IDM8_NITGG|nr:universal stress protein [Candidatus Nitrososphaera gargensis]AFU59501.1 putative universal stress protein A [Candidatus Nitrososphaera gargensis Ga9.2]
MSSQAQQRPQEVKERGRNTSARFKKILVAVDGSEESFKAAQYAIELAKKERERAQLIVLSVNETPSSLISTIEPSALERWRERLKAQSETFYERIVSTYGLDIEDNSELQLRAEMIDSAKSAYVAIVEYAEKEDVDLIVLGTKGKTGLKRILLGSVALGVVTHATCPVLVVK